MAYVGYRYVLPVQNSNDWKRNGEVGVYSNWSLLSTTQLLQDVGDAALPDYPQYARGRHLSQVFNGEFAYKPMEVAKFSHGGQDAPYLRHAHWEFHGVDASEVFPRGEQLAGATAATKTMGTITTGRDYSANGLGALEFTITVDGTDVPVSLTEDYATRPDYVAALNGAVAGATFEQDGSNVLTVTSDSTGSTSSLALSGLVNGAGSGLEEFTTVRGANATYSHGYGYTPTEKKDRNFTFSRHSNWFFYGVDSADSTFTGRVPLAWDDPDLPSYARRHAPYIYKGVGDDHIEDPGEELSVKQARAETSNEYAHQQINTWNGVTSTKAL